MAYEIGIREVNARTLAAAVGRANIRSIGEVIMSLLNEVYRVIKEAGINRLVS